MSKKLKLNAGVIGLGIIGSRIAANLRTAGFQVYVWNRTPKPAPNFLASPAEVAGLCDTIQLVVSDSVALFTIIDAMSSVLSSRHTVICSATVGDRTTLEAARMVEACGAKFVDAPFTGSKEAAEKGQLVYYIGGSDEAFHNAEPMLKATSKAIVRIGKVGDAATVKIVTNMLAAAAVQTLAEACAILGRSGINPGVLAKALEHHGVRSGVLDMKLPKITAGDFDTHFSVKNMFKDVQIAIQAANLYDIDIPATTAAAGALYSAINQGWADMDFSAVAKFYEQEKPAPPPPPVVEPAPEPVKSFEPVEPPAAQEAFTKTLEPVKTVGLSDAPFNETQPAETLPPPVPVMEQMSQPSMPDETNPEMEDIVPLLPAEPLPPLDVANTPLGVANIPLDVANIPPPVEMPVEPILENHLPPSHEPMPVVSDERIPEPALPPPEKPKKPLPPAKLQRSVVNWFSSGRKK